MMVKTVLKKGILFFLLQFLITNGLSYSQAVWTWQNPMPQCNELHEVKFTDQNTGYAVGYSGTVIKTINGGLNWEVLNTNSFADLKGLSIINNSIIYAAGEFTFLKSTNAGANWTASNFIGYDRVDRICFLNANTGYGIRETGSKLYKTTNAGLSWDSIIGINTGLRCLDFINPDIGVVGGFNLTLKRTSNGGINWTTVYSGGANDFFAVHFVNSNTGYAGGHSLIVKTTDAGLNWFVSAQIPGYAIASIASLDADNIVMGCNGTNAVVKTTNGGLNWIILNNGLPLGADGISYPFANVIYAVSQTSRIQKTTNGGNDWFFLTRGSFGSLNEIFFSDLHTGFAIGNAGVFLRTTNGGIYWDSINTGYVNDFRSVYFLDNNTGFIAGSSARIIKTTNSGLNWTIVTGGALVDFRKIFFTDQNTGYALRGDRTLWHTTDRGVNWTVKTYQGPAIVRDVSFGNSGTGFIMNGVGAIYKTTDSGDNWQYAGYTNVALSNIFFVSESTGYIDGKIKTTDGGNTWFNLPQPFPYTSNIRTIHFINENTGFIAGTVYPPHTSAGTVCITTDGGLTWTNEFPGSTEPISIFGIDSSTCYIAGFRGLIMKRTSGGIVSITGNESNIPNRFMLSQNYPNPFNPVTNIKFQIPKSGFVKLTVFDVLGKEIKILVNQQLQTGNYQADFDGSNLSSGVYYYRMETEGFRETKKMVLIK